MSALNRYARLKEKEQGYGGWNAVHVSSGSISVVWEQTKRKQQAKTFTAVIAWYKDSQEVVNF